MENDHTLTDEMSDIANNASQTASMFLERIGTNKYDGKQCPYINHIFVYPHVKKCVDVYEQTFKLGVRVTPEPTKADLRRI